jgi:hypothetical protein
LRHHALLIILPIGKYDDGRINTFAGNEMNFLFGGYSSRLAGINAPGKENNMKY